MVEPLIKKYLDTHLKNSEDHVYLGTHIKWPYASLVGAEVGEVKFSPIFKGQTLSSLLPPRRLT